MSKVGVSSPSEKIIKILSELPPPTIDAEDKSEPLFEYKVKLIEAANNIADVLDPKVSRETGGMMMLMMAAYPGAGADLMVRETKERELKKLGLKIEPKFDASEILRSAINSRPEMEPVIVAVF